MQHIDSNKCVHKTKTRFKITCNMFTRYRKTKLSRNEVCVHLVIYEGNIPIITSKRMKKRHKRRNDNPHPKIQHRRRRSEAINMEGAEPQ